MENHDPYKVKLRQIPQGLNEADLAPYLEAYGMIKDFFLVKGSVGRFKIGFVTYHAQESAACLVAEC